MDCYRAVRVEVGVEVFLERNAQVVGEVGRLSVAVSYRVCRCLIDIYILEIYSPITPPSSARLLLPIYTREPGNVHIHLHHSAAVLPAGFNAPSLRRPMYRAQNRRVPHRQVR